MKYCRFYTRLDVTSILMKAFFNESLKLQLLVLGTNEKGRTARYFNFLTFQNYRRTNSVKFKILRDSSVGSLLKAQRKKWIRNPGISFFFSLHNVK